MGLSPDLFKFEVGPLLCGVAPSSILLIVGFKSRAAAGSHLARHHGPSTGVIAGFGSAAVRWHFHFSRTILTPSMARYYAEL